MQLSEGPRAGSTTGLGDAAHEFPPHPLLSPAQGDRAGRRHAERPRPLPRQARHAEESRGVRAHGRVCGSLAVVRPLDELLPEAEEESPGGFSVAELCDEFLDWAESQYVLPDGTLSREVTNVKLALRPLLLLHADTPAAVFGPKALVQYQEHQIDAGLARKTINQRSGIVKRAFKWAVREEKVPPHVYHGLQAVDGLKKGRSRAKEMSPVESVPREHVDAALPFMPEPVAAMVELQWWSGYATGRSRVHAGVRHRARRRGVDLQAGAAQELLAWTRASRRSRSQVPGGAPAVPRLIRKGRAAPLLTDPVRVSEARRSSSASKEDAGEQGQGAFKAREEPPNAVPLRHNDLRAGDPTSVQEGRRSPLVSQQAAPQRRYPASAEVRT